MTTTWNFLKGTYWYVPFKSLLAMQMSPTDGTVTQMIDQTVWQITNYENGYFWGNCAALLYEKDTTPTAVPSSFRIMGSITPQGKVLIAFMPINQLGALLETTGFGAMREQEKSWVFEMQMASGTSNVVTHWAFMEETQPNDVSWKQLPGTNYSVPNFLAAAGF